MTPSIKSQTVQSFAPVPISNLKPTKLQDLPDDLLSKIIKIAGFKALGRMPATVKCMKQAISRDPLLVKAQETLTAIHHKQSNGAASLEQAIDAQDKALVEILINGGADLWNCSPEKIHQLPKGLTIPASLIFKDDLNRYNRLNSNQLPTGLVIQGNLKLSNSNLGHLPPGLTVNGDLDLNHSSLKQLPSGLRVNGKLDLSHTQITQLPLDLVVEGDLNLSNSELVELPAGLKVGQSISLLNCANLIHLPAGLVVKGNLNLSCTHLRELPAGLVVQGDLDLIYCKHLTQLPKDLNVQGQIFGLKDLNIATNAQNVP